MYERFYGFSEKPFSLLPDPSFLYLGRQHSTAYSLLEYAVLSQAGFTVITGEVGCGKTTLLRHLLNQVSLDVTVGLIRNTANIKGNLLRWVLLAFGEDYKSQDVVELLDCFERFLVDEYAQGRRTVLIVDEAQNLDIETLEELRMLSNINADTDQILQLILVGQPELKAKLANPELQQFAQRVGVTYHLRPLEEQETGDYIRHRLNHVGGDPALFTEAACSVVHGWSGGVPRLINSLCDMALVYSYAEEKLAIDSEMVELVVKDRKASDEPKTGLVDIDGQSAGKAAMPKALTGTFDRDMAKELFHHTYRK